MEIKIIKDKDQEEAHYAEANVDLMGFKEDLPKEWDMEKSIKANTRIKLLDKRYKEFNLKNLIWGALDWAGIMDMLKSNHKPIMNVKFYLVRFKDWKRLYPGKMDKYTMELIERNEEGASTILLQDLTDDKNYDIKAFIKTGCYLYASTDKTKIGCWTRR